MSKEREPATIKTSVMSGLFWSYAGKMSAQVVSFAVSVILARRLDPALFGAVSLVMVLILVGNVLADSGFSVSLVQKKDAGERDFSTAFCFCFVVSAALCLALCLLAPAIAAWFGAGSLTPLIRALAASVVVQSLNTVQRAYVARNMEFRKIFRSTFAGTLVSAAFSVFLAYKGYGAWALVGQHLSNTVVDTLVLGLSIRWRPRAAFDRSRFRVLYAYGWKVFLVMLMDVLYDNARTLAVGKWYSEESLGFYNRGKQFPDLIVANVDASMNTVMFPVMSQSQDDPEQVKRLIRRSISTTTYVLCPLLIGLAAIARPLIALMLTDKWLPCVPVLQIYCLAYVFKPFQAAGMQSVKALGRSDIFLRRDVVKKLYGIALMASAMLAFRSSGAPETLGAIEAVAVSFLIAAALNALVDFLPCRRMLGYSFREVAADVLPTLLLSAGMFAAVFAAGRLELPGAASLALQAVTGITSYALLSIVSKNATFRYLIDSLKGWRK